MCTLAHEQRLGQTGRLTGAPHDRTQPRSGGAHSAGVPPKLCIYDNSTTTTTMTLFARRLINTVPYHASRASIARLLLLVLTCVCVVLCSSACFAITFLFRIVVFCLGMFCFVSICVNLTFCFVVFWFGPHAAVLLQD